MVTRHEYFLSFYFSRDSSTKLEIIEALWPPIIIFIVPHKEHSFVDY